MSQCHSREHVPHGAIGSYLVYTRTTGRDTQHTKGDKVLYEFRTPGIFPVFTYANDPKTREAAQQAFDDRLANNVGYLDTALRLRKQIAEIDSLADYITEVKMVKAQLTQKRFITPDHHFYVVHSSVSSFWMISKHISTLFKLCHPSEAEKGGITITSMWCATWISTIPLSRSTSRYLSSSLLYQNLLGVKFVEITGDARDVWHPEVQQFAVSEKDIKDESGFVGYCYFDPSLAREKQILACPRMGPSPRLRASRRKKTPSLDSYGGKPGETNAGATSADGYDDVTTFFHEMGHVFHGLLSQTKYSRFHGTAVARDFVEAPSQMLENRCWEPEVLKRMSSHYKTQEPFSDDLIAKIIKSRYVNVGLFYLRQLFFANFDLAVHNNSLDVNTDYTKLWNELREKISLVQGSEDKPGQGTFGHIVGGYDVGYYGYTYSLVFAADMYATVFKKAPLDPALGRLYQDKILFVGGSRDDIDSLKDFLGREPDPKAFINEIEQDGNGDAARASNL
ncbi:hypothetical protein EV363DRAFT_1507211 [Boletus edulis]|nr:hypothetical protein EV363DRAFT_1507211 [Boletus edulis]